MKGFTDVNIAYRELKKAYPGEVAAFCCDLGDEWLFKMVPEAEVNNSHFMSGYFGIAVDKKSGRIRQYNMMQNMKTLQTKANLKSLLKG